MHPPPAIILRRRSNARPRCILPPPGYKYRGLTELLHLMRLDRKGKRKMIMCQLHWRVIRGGEIIMTGERRRGASGREGGPVSKLKPETKQTDEQWGSKAKVIKYDKRHEQRTCLFVGDPRSRAPSSPPPPIYSPPRPVPSAVRILMPAVLGKDANWISSANFAYLEGNSAALSMSGK